MKMKIKTIKKQKPTLEFIQDKDKDYIKIPDAFINAQDFKKYVYGKRIPLFSIQYVKYIWGKDWNKHSALLIRMFLNNGKNTEFIVNPQKPFFHYQGGLYVIDPDFLKEDIPSGMYSAYYHQSISIPLDPSFNVDRLIKSIKNDSNVADVVGNINPQTLKAVVNSSAIEKVLAGGELEHQMNILYYLIAGSLLLSFLNLMALGFAFIRR